MFQAHRVGTSITIGEIAKAALKCLRRNEEITATEKLAIKVATFDSCKKVQDSIQFGLAFGGILRFFFHFAATSRYFNERTPVPFESFRWAAIM